MKTDQQLKSDVVAELAWTPTVNATGIGVAVKNGLVTLSGEVDTYLQKHAVERAVRLVGGVRGIAMDLEVRLAPGDKRGDTQVAEAALHALRWHALVPEDKVKVEVEDGWVTLNGEVATPTVMCLASRAAKSGRWPSTRRCWAPPTRPRASPA